MLELTDLTFAYHHADPPVVNALTTALAPGRLCAMIGPNAAGKSTILRLILGQLTAQTGSIRIQGRETQSLSPAARAASVSYVPQRGLMSFAFTVEQVVAMGRFALTRNDAAIEHALEQTDLTALRHRICRELSAGQQQRVLLARAICQAAPTTGETSGGTSGETSGGQHVMLLDEPSSAMDLWHVHQTMTTLRRLADQGLAVLAVLHDINLAARYADEVWLLDGGRLAAAGPWQEVLTPSVLEPVYGIELEALHSKDASRPVFAVTASSGTMSPNA